MQFRLYSVDTKLFFQYKVVVVVVVLQPSWSLELHIGTFLIEIA